MKRHERQKLSVSSIPLRFGDERDAAILEKTPQRLARRRRVAGEELVQLERRRRNLIGGRQADGRLRHERHERRDGVLLFPGGML